MIRALSCISVLSIALQLSAFDVNVSVQHAICGGPAGSIEAIPTEGGEYTYQWSTGVTTPWLSDVPPGVYSVIVSNASGASIQQEVEVLEVLFQPFEATAYSCTPGCNGFLNQFIPLSGSTTYTVVFDPPGPQGGASPNGIYFNNLCIGTEYTATITNSEGCTGVVGPINVVGPTQPQLLSTAVTGSCPGGATGSVTLVFDQASFIYISGAGITDSLPGFTNPYTLTNLAPGEYSGFAMGSTSGTPNTSCETLFSFEIPVTDEPCGQLSGVVFADLNDDCAGSDSEPGLPHRILEVQPGGYLILTDASGHYSTELPLNDYTLDASLDGYASLCTPLPSAFQLNASNLTATIDLPLQPLFGPDVSAHLSMGVHVPGFEVDYHVSVQNQGPYPFNGHVLDLFFDPILLPGGTEGSPTLVASGHYQWVLGELGPFASQQFSVSFTVPPTASLIGTEVLATATVITLLPDADPDNDSYSVSRTIVGAFDPNDKLVQTSSGVSDDHYYLDLDDHMDYTIRFQNTGTAPAINVYLLDTIGLEFDLMSLEILGASHPFEASMQPGRVLRFDFHGIMLPDSTSDIAGSQGYASFRLKPVSGIIIGDVLMNAADIFFDFNEPIRTNDAVLTADVTVGIAEGSSGEIGVFPNPASDQLRITLADGNWMVDVIAMDGRGIAKHRISGAQGVIPVAHLATGQYLLRATGADGATMITRFVRQ